jgi:hypothetical protein
MATKASINLTE